MNSCNFLVKIISMPQQCLVGKDISKVEVKVQLGKLRKKKSSFNEFKITIWGNTGKYFLQFYRIGDYIIIQGILNFKRHYSKTSFQKDTKFTVIKIYPFLLTEDYPFID